MAAFVNMAGIDGSGIVSTLAGLMAANRLSFYPSGRPATYHVKKGKKKITAPCDVTEVSGGPNHLLALIYRCPLVEDNDGAPNAYGPKHLQPLEKYLQDATSHPDHHFIPGKRGSPFKWVGVVSVTPQVAKESGLVIDHSIELEDRNGTFPVVRRHGRYAGYYVSKTNAITGLGQVTEQSHYLDAAEVPYAVLPVDQLGGKGSSAVSIGDVGFAIRGLTGASCGFFFGDTRGKGVGECSRKVVRTLSPSGPCDDPVTFIVFPRSGIGKRDAKHHLVFPPGEEKLIDTALRNRLGALTVMNAFQLVRFMALGSDLHRFRSNSLTPGARTNPPTHFSSFYAALMKFCPSLMGALGDFPTANEAGNGQA